MTLRRQLRVSIEAQQESLSGSSSVTWIRRAFGHRFCRRYRFFVRGGNILDIQLIPNPLCPSKIILLPDGNPPVTAMHYELNSNDHFPFFLEEPRVIQPLKHPAC